MIQQIGISYFAVTTEQEHLADNLGRLRIVICKWKENPTAMLAMNWHDEQRSGHGKSIATFQALSNHLAAGRLGVWLPAHYFQGTFSIETAIDGWLRAMYPMLEPDAGRIAMRIAAENGGLIIAIDDINHSSESGRLLRYFISIARTTSARNDDGDQTNGKQAQRTPLHLIVPVWPEHFSLLPQKLIERPEICTLSDSSLSASECVRLIQDQFTNLSTVEAEEYANKLSNDPFLIGLFVLIAGNNTDCPDLAVAADQAIESFLNTQIASLVAGSDLLAHEFRTTLVQVAREMIVRRQLQPQWRDLEAWFGEESKLVRGIRRLAQQGQICKVGTDGQVSFRHDRLQHFFLVRAMQDFLRAGHAHDDLIEEPHFSSIVGTAIARMEIDVERLKTLRLRAPWTLFEAIKEFGEPSCQSHYSILEAAHAWAESSSREAPESVLSAICWTMLGTDSKHLLGIIDAMPENRLLMLAGLRNGSATYGMQYIRGTVKHEFEPGMGSSLRDRIVMQARHRHSASVANQIDTELKRNELSVDDTNGYLALIGHFRLEITDYVIAKIWKRLGPDVLGYAIWACAACPLKDCASQLRPLLEYLGSLPTRDKSTGSLSDREWLALYLSWAFRRNCVTDDALKVFLTAAAERDDIRTDIALIIEGVDHPDAMELVARHLANGYGSNLWRNIHFLSSGELERHPRSSATVSHLRDIWTSPKESEKVRLNAFCLWANTCEQTPIYLLQSIDSTTPYYRQAVQYRIKLSDMSVVPALLLLLAEKKIGGWWWMIAHHVWCDQIRLAASQALGGLAGKIPSNFSGGRSDLLHHLADLLISIPPEHADPRIIKRLLHQLSHRLTELRLRWSCRDLLAENLGQHFPTLRFHEVLIELIQCSHSHEHCVAGAFNLSSCLFY